MIDPIRVIAAETKSRRRIHKLCQAPPCFDDTAANPVVEGFELGGSVLPVGHLAEFLNDFQADVGQILIVHLRNGNVTKANHHGEARILLHGRKNALRPQVGISRFAVDESPVQVRCGIAGERVEKEFRHVLLFHIQAELGRPCDPDRAGLLLISIGIFNNWTARTPPALEMEGPFQSKASGSGAAARYD